MDQFRNTIDLNTKYVPLIILFFILVITCAVYWPGLHGPLLLDDIPNLFHLHRFGNGIIGWKRVFELTPHGMSRPVAITSFLLNWMTTGNNLWALKFTNLIIHLLCGVLIYWLSWLLLNYDIFKNKMQAQYVALWITALWLLSPFLLSTVLYVIQRMTQLSALFTLCGLLLYVIGRINYEKKEFPGKSLIIFSLIIFWPLATFSKENGILLPLLIFIIEIFIFYKNSTLPDIRNLRLVLVTWVFIPGLVILFICLKTPELLPDSYSGRNFTLYERLITQPRILLDYIGNLLLVPGVSPMGLFHDDFIKSTSILTPVTTLPSLIFLIIIMLCSYISMGKKAGVLFFGIIFFYAAHLVESSFIPLELYFEHRNYLPAFGIYFSIVSGIAILLKKTNYKNIAVAAFLIVPITFSILTCQRALIWQKKTNIYFLSEIHHPDSPRLNEGLAYIYLLNNDSDRALYYLDRVIKLEQKRRSPEFYFKYLLAYCYGNRKMNDGEYKNKIKILSLENELSTVTYFQKFVDSVQKGRCHSLDLNRIADNFTIAVNNRDRRYDKDDISFVNILLANLLSYLGRNEEAEKQRIEANLYDR